MNDPQQMLVERFQAAIAKAFGEGYRQVDPLIRPAQNPKFGDYQANVAMSLAKQVGKPPREVATVIVAHLDLAGVCQEPQIAGPGFINLTLEAGYVSEQAAQLARDPRLGVEPVEAPQGVVVDYSGPNVAKEMHVGHLRSSVIGDALARVLDFLGQKVIRQNHLGDWGTQFGMLIEYLMDQERAGKAVAQSQIGDLNQLYRDAKQQFDADPAFADRARRRVVLLQSGDERTLELWRYLVEESKRHFNQVYRRLNVTLTDEDIRSESFYNPMLPEIVEELEARGMTTLSEGAVCVFLPGFTGRDDEPLPMIIRKSDGGYLYATTDLAAIRYRSQTLNASRVIYVTDARQKQHFGMVFKAAELAGWLNETQPEHVPFGTVLGEDGKPFKTRSGETVKLVDLLDEAERRALGVVTEKNPDLDQEARARVAEVVGIGAIKYADLSNDRVKDYVFSWDRMLAMDGNTAPYLQYAYARIRSIFRRAEESGAAGEGGAKLTDALSVEHPAEKALVLKIMQLGSVVRSVADSLEPHRLCTYLYELATAFSGFYENCPVLQAGSESTRHSRLILCDLTARTLKQGLTLLGIEVLERM